MLIEEQMEKSKLMQNLKSNIEVFQATEEEFGDKIKNRCFLCKLEFENSWWYYCTYGNMCRWCSSNLNTSINDKDREGAVGRLALRKDEVEKGIITKNTNFKFL